MLPINCAPEAPLALLLLVSLCNSATPAPQILVPFIYARQLSLDGYGREAGIDCRTGHNYEDLAANQTLILHIYQLTLSREILTL